MRFVIPIVALSSLASALVAPQDDSFFLDNVPLDKRQTGDPTYQCHANCGYTIQKGVGDYCKNEEWLGLLRGCLDCALQYDIWKSYGNKVSAAAKACGLDATPKPVSPGGNASSSSSNAGSVAPSSSAPPAQQSSQASSVAPVTTSAAATSAPRSVTTSAGQPAPTTSAGHSNNGTATVPTGAAAAMKQQLPLAAAGALLAALVM